MNDRQNKDRRRDSKVDLIRNRPQRVAKLSSWCAALGVLWCLTFISVVPARADLGLSWDLGASTGSYNNVGYSEVNLGVNWSLTDYLIWRNSVFSRFPSTGDGVQGLDTSLRLHHFVTSDSGTFGLGFFGGPGYRFASSTYSAAFAEAGLLVKLGGLQLGGGVKAFRYSNPGTTTTGVALPPDDVTYFIILSGGGAL